MTPKGFFFLLTLTLIFPVVCLAQTYVNTGINTTTPDPSAQLEIFSNDKGLLIPRHTTASRLAITNPATGLMVYDTDLNEFWYFDGSNWISMQGPAGPAGAPGQAGVGIVNSVSNPDGTITFTYSDSTTFTTSPPSPRPVLFKRITDTSTWYNASNNPDNGSGARYKLINTGILVSEYECTIGGWSAYWDMYENDNRRRKFWIYDSNGTWVVDYRPGIHSVAPGQALDIDIICFRKDFTEWQGQPRTLNNNYGSNQ